MHTHTVDFDNDLSGRNKLTTFWNVCAHASYSNPLHLPYFPKLHALFSFSISLPFAKQYPDEHHFNNEKLSVTQRRKLNESPDKKNMYAIIKSFWLNCYLRILYTFKLMCSINTHPNRSLFYRENEYRKMYDKYREIEWEMERDGSYFSLSFAWIDVNGIKEHLIKSGQVSRSRQRKRNESNSKIW